MKHPNKPGLFKVVVRNGSFCKAPLSETQHDEANASIKERRALMTRVGLVNGELPGLMEDYARAMARRLENARRGRNYARHRRA